MWSAIVKELSSQLKEETAEIHQQLERSPFLTTLKGGQSPPNGKWQNFDVHINFDSFFNMLLTDPPEIG